MSAMQRRKGARVERQAAALLTRCGFPAERAARSGVDGGEDLICKCLRIHLEVKGDRSIDIGTKALEDAVRQAGECVMGIGRPASSRIDVSTGYVWLDWETNPHAVLWWRHRKGWALSYPEPWGIATIAGEEAIEAYLVRFVVNPEQGKLTGCR